MRTLPYRTRPELSVPVRIEHPRGVKSYSFKSSYVKTHARALAPAPALALALALVAW